MAFQGVTIYIEIVLSVSKIIVVLTATIYVYKPPLYTQLKNCGCYSGSLQNAIFYFRDDNGAGWVRVS